MDKIKFKKPNCDNRIIITNIISKMNLSLHQNFDITKTNIINVYELLKTPKNL
jgi:hypothetical protein